MSYKFNPFTGKFDFNINKLVKLVDFPNSYINQAGKLVFVKPTEDGIAFSDGLTWDSVNASLKIAGELDVEGVSYFGDSGNSHHTTFSSSGHQSMEGNARPWRDELADALTLEKNGPGISANLTEGVVEFSDASNLDDYALKNLQMNHDKDLSSSIYPHIHFFQDNNNIPNFLLQYRWQIGGGAKTTAWTSIKCNTPVYTYTSGTLNQKVYSSGITPPGGTQLSDIVQFRIIRDNDNDSGLFTGIDTYTGTVGISYFDSHFQLNSIGSDEQYTK